MEVAASRNAPRCLSAETAVEIGSPLDLHAQHAHGVNTERTSGEPGTIGLYAGASRSTMNVDEKRSGRQRRSRQARGRRWVVAGVSIPLAR